AGMMDCKKALDATNGDLEAAFDWLREKGIAKAAKKADRIAAEGLAAFAIDGDKAALVEVNSETDFVAKNEEFKELVNMIAKAVAEAQVNTVEETLKLVVDGQDLDTIIKEKTGKIGEKLSLRRVVAMSKSEGETFGAYSHMGGTVAALVKVANADDEKARDVAMHVAASAPQYISEDEIPEDVRERELNVLKTQALEENAKAAKPKPENILHKIVEGRLKKNFKEVCLNDQAFIKNPDQTVAQYLGNGKVEMMARFKVGEGIEKKEENFAAEVAAQMKA
ncbi:MAG TPA: elongation factor Ts, partial [Erysipelotrichaceae bacterium]|nr:elongation factor Ts [Erysipelotrichaceae bacterium]